MNVQHYATAAVEPACRWAGYAQASCVNAIFQ